jgi:hypothetical protein
MINMYFSGDFDHFLAKAFETCDVSQNRQYFSPKYFNFKNEPRGPFLNSPLAPRGEPLP